MRPCVVTQRRAGECEEGLMRDARSAEAARKPGEPCVLDTPYGSSQGMLGSAPGPPPRLPEGPARPKWTVQTRRRRCSSGARQRLAPVSKARSSCSPRERLTVERPNTMQYARRTVSSQPFSHQRAQPATERAILSQRRRGGPSGLSKVMPLLRRGSLGRQRKRKRCPANVGGSNSLPTRA
jgi:hypothetical protein